MEEKVLYEVKAIKRFVIYIFLILLVFLFFYVLLPIYFYCRFFSELKKLINLSSNSHNIDFHHTTKNHFIHFNTENKSNRYYEIK